MKKTKLLKVYDFGEYPGPRYKSQGLDSAELFYEDLLNPYFKEAVADREILTLDLDFTAGYSPSFIDEIFGNLIYDFDFKDIEKFLKIKSEEEPHWINVVKEDVWPKWIKKKNAGEPRKPQG